MRPRYVLLGLAVTLACAVAPWVVVSATAQAASPGPGATPPGRKDLDRGRYLVIVGGCNDCHTDGYAPSEGKVPESAWLLGSGLGFRGPWGTTYAPNLRLTLSKMREAEWVKYAQALKTRPPMPWFNLNAMTASDLRAMYRFVKSLGPVGQPGSPYMPPGQEPNQPYLQWPAAPK
jgi:mono/diheme cytochrome c family protein